MLVLSRKKNERIVVKGSDGRRLEVVVVEIRGDKVRLGFRAGPEDTIWRAELGEEFRRGAEGGVRREAAGVRTDGATIPESPAPSPSP